MIMEARSEADFHRSAIHIRENLPLVDVIQISWKTPTGEIEDNIHIHMHMFRVVRRGG